MGLFNNWIYLDEHELNLDWIIRTVRQAVDNLKALNKEFDNLEISFEDLKQYVDDYFKNLNIDEKIQEAIQEMIESGELDPVILEAFDHLNSRVIALENTVNMNKDADIVKFGRLLDTFKKENRSQALGGQGVTYFNGQYFTSGERYSDNKQVIAIWDNMGTLLHSYDFDNLGHAQSIAVDDDNFYVVEGVQSNNLHKINRNTLVDITLPVEGFSYLLGVSIFDNRLFIAGRLSGNEDLAIAEIVDNTPIILVEDLAFTQTFQNLSVYNNKAFILTSGITQILEYNLTNAELDNIYNIPNGKEYEPLGEAESIFIQDGKLYVSGALYTPGHTGEEMGTIIMTIFQTSVLGEFYGDQRDTYSYINRPTITVNGAGNILFNPDLTQLTTIEEASAIANYNKAAIIRITNLTGGMLDLHQGQYRIVGVGNNSIDIGYITDADVISVAGLTFIDRLIITESIIEFINLTFAKTVIVHSSSIRTVKCNYSAVESYTSDTSNSDIEHPVGDFTQDVVITSAGNGVMNYIGRYTPTSTKYSLLSGGGGYKATINKLVSGEYYITSSLFNIAALTGSIVRNTFDCSQVKSINITNGEISITQINDTPVSLNNNDVLQLLQAWR